MKIENVSITNWVPGKTARLESIINFKVNQIVKINPNWHDYKNELNYEKIKDRRGIVRSINETAKTISVRWDESNATRRYSYKRLLIKN